MNDNEIKQVAVIDDDPMTREAYSLHIEELAMRPWQVAGPFTAFAECVANIVGSAQAAISDFKLGVKTSSTFTGAELVAALYDRRVPAILCTRFGFADLNEIRPYRPRIPVLLSPDDLDAEAVKLAFERCVLEFRSEYAQSRRPWKALVRVEDVYQDLGQQSTHIDVCVPSWRRNVMLPLLQSELPEWMHSRLTPGERFYAEVNLGAERPEDLYFVHWSAT